MEQYILKYIFDHTDDPEKRRFLDYMKIEMDKRLWSTGLNIPYSFDTQKQVRLITTQYERKISLWLRLKRKVHAYIAKKAKVEISSPQPVEPQRVYQHNVLSLVENIAKENLRSLNELGIGVTCLGDLDVAQFPSARRLCNWFDSLSALEFNQLLDDKYANQLDELFHDVLKEIQCANLDALLVRTSELFYEKFFIDIFKEIKKPSITLLHGLPAIYSLVTESRSDYLLVWGEKIRENFISIGYNPDRVLVAGNFKYDSSSFEKNSQSLRFCLDDVLILTADTYSEFQHEWEWEKFPAQDRSLLVTYLYSIETVLKKCGVTHARLRPHPAVSKEWLAEYMDTNFYQLDYENFEVSLQKATLCIGQTSSTMLEAIMNGVSYLVYEPGDGKQTMTRAAIVPPFDGKDKRLKVAYTEEELEQLINIKYKPEVSLLDDYLQPFDADKIKFAIIQSVENQRVIRISGGGK